MVFDKIILLIIIKKLNTGILIDKIKANKYNILIQKSHCLSPYWAFYK